MEGAFSASEMSSSWAERLGEGGTLLVVLAAGVVMGRWGGRVVLVVLVWLRAGGWERVDSKRGW